MIEENYQFNLQQVKVALAEMAEAYPLLPELVYSSPYDFVLQHGRDYKIVPWKWGKEGVGVQKQCFGNSIALAAKYDLKYVEGFTLAVTGELIMHAWNAFPNGEVMDSTWANTGLAYFGVEFSVERGDDATWNGDACVLNDDNRNYPIFHQKWEGEDYSIQWPPSDRLDAIKRWRKTGKYIVPPTAAAWLQEQKKV
jgi:hypothetical protein